MSFAGRIYGPYHKKNLVKSITITQPQPFRYSSATYTWVKK